MPIRRTQATIYFVDEWDAAIAFYRDVLGLKEIVNFLIAGRSSGFPAVGVSRCNRDPRTPPTSRSK
jgi:catechol 2,3-dioxygenase-like lactoylglutathione lyase family enzyme